MCVECKKIKMHRTPMMKKITKCPFRSPRLLKAQQHIKKGKAIPDRRPEISRK
jgi:hypothetical protein